MDKILPAPGSLRIELENHFKVRVYNTSSAVCGHVIINCKQDMRFDDLDIYLLGTSKTSLRGSLSHLSLGAERLFLRLPMPYSDSSLPTTRVFESGKQYSVPFHFIIPERLTVNACPHGAKACVHDAHTQLPPSMGAWERDTFSPGKARISYAIVAAVSKRDSSSGAIQVLLENSKDILVLPSVLDEPPLDVQPSDTMYRLTKTKALRSSVLSPTIGTITATTFQPAAIMLDGDGQAATNTTVQLNLKFSPRSSKLEFPTITKISTRVKSVTIFGFKGYSEFPNFGDWTQAAVHSNWRCNTVAIPHAILEQSMWKQGQLEHKHLYNVSDCSDGEDRKSFEEDVATGYQAKTRISISLPASETTFLPTFHDCILTRIYVLLLSATVSAGGSTSTLNLRIPLQIGVRNQDQDDKPEYKDLILA